jgi:hypothetical protein
MSQLSQTLPSHSARARINVCFSNRPVWVKRCQTIPRWRCRCRSQARASLRNRHIGPSIMGFEDEVEQSFPRHCCSVAGPSGHANSPHPSSREGHHSTVGWSSSFLLWRLMPHGPHDAAIASLVQRNSVPSTQMRCMITASRRPSATIAFFLPRFLAIFIAQALSQDRLAECINKIWAAS